MAAGAYKLTFSAYLLGLGSKPIPGLEREAYYTATSYNVKIYGKREPERAKRLNYFASKNLGNQEEEKFCTGENPSIPLFLSLSLSLSLFPRGP